MITQTYQYTLTNPHTEKHSVKDKKMIIFTLVSCMCNNISFLKLTRKEDGISISHYNDHCSLALSNLQMERGASDGIEWAFLDDDYREIVRIINTGTSKICNTKMR